MYYVAQYTTRGEFTGSLFGPFPSEGAATEFRRVASLGGGYHYLRLTALVTDDGGYVDKEGVIEAINKQLPRRSKPD